RLFFIFGLAFEGSGYGNIAAGNMTGVKAALSLPGIVFLSVTDAVVLVRVQRRGCGYIDLLKQSAPEINIEIGEFKRISQVVIASGESEPINQFHFLIGSRSGIRFGF